MTAFYEEIAPSYRHTKELVRKNYICDLYKLIGGRFYCFKNRRDADSWFDGPRIEWLTKRYSKTDVEYFENPVMVNNVAEEIFT